MLEERWLKVDEQPTLRQIRLDIEVLKRRWPDRYRYLVQKRLGGGARYELFLKHRRSTVDQS